MTSKGSVSSRLKPPTTVIRRATLATCRSRPNVEPQQPALSSRVPNVPKPTTASGPSEKLSTTSKPPTRTLKRQMSNLENSAPAAKVRKNETGRGLAKKVGSKRPAWDYKGRLEDMEKYVQATSERLEVLEATNSQLKGNNVMKKKEFDEVSARSHDLQARLASLLASKTEMEQRYKLELSAEREEKERIDREREELKFDLEIARNEVNTLKRKVSSMTTEALAVTTELQATKVAFAKTSEENRQQANLIQTLKSTVEAQLQTIASCEEKLREEESVRRKLHNTIQELKGNIRVFCRVRPSLVSEKDLTLSNIDFPNDTNLVVCQQNGTESISGGKRAPSRFPFTFDKVFTPQCTQDVVFGEISQLIQSVLDGYNVCIFAYGQTGSGKTFTMEGDLKARESWGMIPRALEQVFYTCENLKSKGWQYEMEASFLEIYNETIRDLLGTGDSSVKHDIRIINTQNGKPASDVEVTNLRTVVVTSSDQVSSLLHKACENRAVAATNCNERSSRSHSVFRLKMSGQNTITEERCQGTLNLVDLAGSERLSQSGSTGARLKETQNINKSLSNLGIVIMALANKEQHVPFRNSKLTYLLQNSLGGNSKSLMFVNISPREDSFQETLSSLRFATKFTSGLQRTTSQMPETLASYQQALRNK